MTMKKTGHINLCRGLEYVKAVSAMGLIYLFILLCVVYGNGRNVPTIVGHLHVDSTGIYHFHLLMSLHSGHGHKCYMLEVLVNQLVNGYPCCMWNKSINLLFGIHVSTWRLIVQVLCWRISALSMALSSNDTLHHFHTAVYVC